MVLRKENEIQEIEPDNINHPAHYEAGGYECEKVMEAVFGKEAVAVWSKLNAFKYLWRCDHKQQAPTEDIEKAEWYLKKYLELKGGQNGKSDWNKNETAASFTLHDTAGSGI